MILDNLRALIGSTMKSTSTSPTVTKTDGTTGSGTYVKLPGVLTSTTLTSIVVGRGTDIVKRSDYKLADQITTGIAISNASSYEEIGTEKTNTIWRYSAVVENTSDEAITINEIGLMTIFHATTKTETLLIRENVDPYILQPNESVQISISIN